jgi:hypothetical protein
MSDYWISWIQGGDDCRPLSYPPNKGIIGWWKTGETDMGDSTLVAWVRARFDSDARDAILIDWPEALDTGDWRFFERKSPEPLSDRFPLSEWMKERI